MKWRGGGLVVKVVKRLFPRIRRYYINYPSFGDLSVAFLDYEWVAQCARGPSECGLVHVLERFSNHESVIWVVGANSGFTAVDLFVRTNPAQMILFEPNPEHEETLRSIQEAQPNIRVRMTGLSDAQKQACLYIPGDHETGSCCASLDRDIADLASSSSHRQNVQLEIGDALVDQHLVAAPSIITLDTEGHELKALRGLATTIKIARPIIAIEHLFLQDSDIVNELPMQYKIFTVNDITGELSPGIIKWVGHNCLLVPEEVSV